MSNPDTWLQDGPLLYRLTDDRHPVNRDEISVTMVDGSRDLDARAARASELLASLAPTEAAAMAATVPTIEQVADFLRGALNERTFRTDGDVMVLAERMRHMSRSDRDHMAAYKATLAEYKERLAAQAPVADQPADASPPHGLTPEQIDRLLQGSLKPEEINGDPATRHKRVRELLHWFARYQEGHANPKWAKDHAMELAYYIATTSPQREVNVTAIHQAGYLEGLRAGPEDRAMMERIGALPAPKGDSNG